MKSKILIQLDNQRKYQFQGRNPGTNIHMTEIPDEHSLVTQDHGAVASRTHNIRCLVHLQEVDT